MEFSTQIVPPALDQGNLTIKNVRTEVIGPEIEEVCPEKVIICGKVKKTFEYTKVLDDGTKEKARITDERPFQCVIDREDANEGDSFKIVGSAILCEGTPRVHNMGTKQVGDKSVKVFWRVVEKDIIKVCIRKNKK